jgi:ATP-dependent RNA circularization protein (DNA/RNA ligase family)
MTDERLTLRQAATRLGVSESAIRKRVERGTLRSDKGRDGRRYVYLDTGADGMADEGADASAPREHDALISELRAHNDTLREQLEAERQAHAEARRIIAGLVERIPAIEAPQEASEASETAREEPERAERPATGGAQEGVQRPWWRRVFGS